MNKKMFDTGLAACNKDQAGHGVPPDGDLDMKYDQRHGGPWDRGSADAYYRREFDPHYFEGDTGSSKRIPIKDGTTEYAAYREGYIQQEDFKDWG